MLVAIAIRHPKTVGLDEDLPSITSYRDLDGDGFGDRHGNVVLLCSVLPGYARNNTDCDDADVTVNPRVAEICDAKDNDCDSTFDEASACIGTACVVALATVCDPIATCQEVGNAAVCACPPGFLDLSGGAATGIYCTDIDECRSSSLNTCDTNATCANTAGGLTCTCNVGFAGDGFTCVPN